jgi:alpha-aminoadipic semialdehyde synthase
MNMLSGAKYLKDGHPVMVDKDGGLMESVEPMNFLPGFHLEGYPNRDSTIYGDLYGIREAHTLLRGTLRYAGYTDVIKGLVRIGLLSPNQHPALHSQGPEITWRQLMCKLLGHSSDSTIFYDNLLEMINERSGSVSRTNAMVQLGLLSEEKVEKLGTPLDTLSHHLANVLSYEPDERDMILMRHEVIIKWPDNRRENRGINLVCYGDPEGYSAMAKTVGFPCAIATRMVLDKEIQRKGMVLPFTADIYRPMIDRLKSEGIIAKETSRFIET